MGNVTAQEVEQVSVSEVEIARENVGNDIDDARQPLGVEHDVGVHCKGSKGLGSLEVVEFVVAEVGTGEPAGSGGGVGAR
mmetsp:Transcript_22773/g.49451  ORF Transcript_22773/g.49451 Transcript_22773/m.49451 type:complete len:80 (+) Transcript_22773:727-966(+)